MSERHRLAELQLAIMQILWSRGEATVGQVREDLAQQGRELAYTTVATMLSKMEGNGQVDHRTEGRVLVYRPALQREKVHHWMVSDLTSRLFGGSVTDMMAQLLDGCEVSPDELDRLKTLIREKEQEVRGDK